MKDDVQIWLDEAKWDLRSAKILLQNESYNTAIFLSQQSSEKAVKALLFFCNLNGWGHSITKLLDKYKEIKGRDISSIAKDALNLDKQYIPTRYPDSLPGIAPHKAFNKEEADSAVKKATSIINFVENELETIKKTDEEEKVENEE